jgi:uncharacterized protein (DUF1684 family)
MNDLQEHRDQKDAYFASSRQSPIEDKDFGGLNYYPENPALVFTARLEPSGEREVLELQTSTGDVQPYVRYGRVRFTHEGQEHTLTLFAAAYDAEPDRLFLPFKDATNGTETYGAGRYLEVPLGTGDTVTLDFNYAYNPFCAYSDRWRCPLPPFENHLTMPIRAGEKVYK